ncbi:MAG: nuclear transport factor 2 family protein [Pseudomonadota bacterium]|nr:nuclear transport factor 2 family protein [Pseudomonadota bacterium]
MNKTEQHQRTWETYTSAWQAPTAGAKAIALQASVDAGCVYRDPLTGVVGHAALIDYMIGFHQQVPGGSFKTTSFRAHSARSVATWHMCDAGGAVIGEGISYGEYAGDGKLLAMTGFFDVPAQEGR